MWGMLCGKLENSLLINTVRGGLVYHKKVVPQQIALSLS
jgi:hypothetical protein